MARGLASDVPVDGMKIFTMKIICTGLLLTATTVNAGAGNESDCYSHTESEQAGEPGQSPNPQELGFRQSWEETECLRQTVIAKGAEWIGTKGLLTRSLQAAERGEFETASRLLKEADFQVKMALKQADTEAQAWKHRVVD